MSLSAFPIAFDLRALPRIDSGKILEAHDELTLTIDSGIDYNHPALGAGFGAGFKVVGGYDFVGDDYDGLWDPMTDDLSSDTLAGTNTPVPDPDPLDQCDGNTSFTRTVARG